MNKQEAATLLANSPKAFVKVFGAKVNTLHVGIGEGVVEETLAKGHSALKRGLKVQWADGRQQWETTMQVFDSSKVGSAQFTWDSSGDKVKHEVFLVTKFPNGDVTKEFVRNSWRLFE